MPKQISQSDRDTVVRLLSELAAKGIDVDLTDGAVTFRPGARKKTGLATSAITYDDIWHIVTIIGIIAQIVERLRPPRPSSKASAAARAAAPPPRPRAAPRAAAPPAPAKKKASVPAHRHAAKKKSG